MRRIEGRRFRGLQPPRPRRFASASRPSQALSSRQLVPRPTQPKDIQQSASHTQWLGILGDAAIADLGKSEDAFEHQKGMPDAGVNSGLVAILVPLDPIDTVAVSVTPLRHVSGARCVPMDHIGSTLIGRVAPHTRFFAMQQHRQRQGVAHVGRTWGHRMNDRRAAVHPDMRVHAKVPLVAFFGLTHLGIALPAAAFRRRGRGNDRGVHNRAGADLKTVTGQVCIHCPQDLLVQRMGFQAMAKLANRRLIGRRLTAQIDPDKRAHRARIVQRFLHRGIGQVEPVLQKVNAQHPLKSNRRAACAIPSRICRLDQRAELLPRHHGVHLRNKLLARVGLRYFSKAASANVSCFRRMDSSLMLNRCSILSRNMLSIQRFPSRLLKN